jgi:hypothetical protein
MNELEFDENEILDLFENNQMISDKEKLKDKILVGITREELKLLY